MSSVGKSFKAERALLFLLIRRSLVLSHIFTDLRDPGFRKDFRDLFANALKHKNVKFGFNPTLYFPKTFYVFFLSLL